MKCLLKTKVVKKMKQTKVKKIKFKMIGLYKDVEKTKLFKVL